MNPLKQLMKQKGLTGTALAKLVGCSQPEISRLAKYPDGGRKMTVEWAERIAPHLGVAPEALLFADKLDALSDFEKIVQVPLIGETAAGRWFEQDVLFDDEPPLISLVLGKYQRLEQFAFRVVGNSMNRKRLHNGDIIVCVPYFDARTQITEGDIVVVERKQGHLTERTVKQIERGIDGWELWPRSTDPAHQEPIVIPYRDGPPADDGVHIEITGLVIWVQAPIN